MKIDKLYYGSTSLRSKHMSLYTVQQIKRIVEKSENIQNEMEKATYEALLSDLEDDHVINMSTAFRLH
jgi:hypothetical protein